MVDPLDPARVRALAEHLIAIGSASPDPAGERACADALRESLPRGVESGAWDLADGRRTVWALRRGRSRRAVLLLGHVDTVGVAEYAALGAGEAIACDPAPLRERLLEAGRDHPAAPVRRDLEEEARSPGTWLFGRGALDMKSGLAAGVAALEALAPPDSLEGSVLFVACPDEENASAGMLAALPELVALRDREGLELAGALNLDFGAEPGAWNGVVGKTLVGAWVLGDPTHASDPSGGVDAARLAAEIAARAARGDALADRDGARTGPPPAVLRLRDLKTRYDAQTAIEAVIELNVITFGRAVAGTLEAALAVARGALAEVAGGRGRVLTVAELRALAGGAAGDDGGAGVVDSPEEARAATLERVRRWARAARLAGPAVVLYALPPWYPHLPPGEGSLVRAARTVLGAEGLEVRPWYPHISDASYLAWRGEPPERMAPLMPALGREYRLPVEASRALDLEVVNLGPWGRDAHGLYERVHAGYAFGVLPRLVAGVVREAVG